MGMGPWDPISAMQAVLVAHTVLHADSPLTSPGGLHLWHMVPPVTRLALGAAVMCPGSHVASAPLWLHRYPLFSSCLIYLDGIIFC